MRARDRPVLQPASGHAHQHLGRRTQDVSVARPQEIKIWRWIHLPQRTIQVKRRDPRSEVETLREYYLEDIAGSNVLFATLHAAQEGTALRASIDLQPSAFYFLTLPQYGTESSRELFL